MRAAAERCARAGVPRTKALKDAAAKAKESLNGALPSPSGRAVPVRQAAQFQSACPARQPGAEPRHPAALTAGELLTRLPELLRKYTPDAPKAAELAAMARRVALPAAAAARRRAAAASQPPTSPQPKPKP